MGNLTQQEKDDVVGHTLKKQEEEISRLKAEKNGLREKLEEMTHAYNHANELDRTNEELQAENEKLAEREHIRAEAAKQERDSWKTQWVECCENLDIVAKERDLYKKALEFYADEKNYLTIHAENPAPNVVMDDGEKAREALKPRPRTE